MAKFESPCEYKALAINGFTEDTDFPTIIAPLKGVWKFQDQLTSFNR